MKYRIHFRQPAAIQHHCETFNSPEDMGRRIVDVSANGYKVESVETFEPEQDPDNVRFDYETGARIQYYDADDASEHHLRMMGG